MNRPLPSRVAAQHLAKTFTLNVGDPVLYGKYKNKKGIIKEFKTGPKGDPIVVIEQVPNPTGRKQPKELKLFKIRYDKDRAEAMKEKKAFDGHPYRKDEVVVVGPMTDGPEFLPAVVLENPYWKDKSVKNPNVHIEYIGEGEKHREWTDQDNLMSKSEWAEARPGEPFPAEQKKTAAEMLPVMDPAFNIREICKQLILLEDHLQHPPKQCPDCIRKHLLAAEALAEEAVSLDKDQKHTDLLDGLADKIRVLWRGAHGGVPFSDVALGARMLRKSLVPTAATVKVGSSNAPKPHSPKVWNRSQESQEEWEKEWLWRLQHGQDDPRWDTIARGISVSTDLPLDLAEDVLSGKATAKDILGLISGGAGDFWWLLGQGGASLRDAEGYAVSGAGVELTTSWGQRELEDARKGVADEVGVEIPVVLIAERPEDWHPDDNPSTGLMGNSYLDPKIWKSVRLKKIRYSNGEKWFEKPVSGNMKLATQRAARRAKEPWQMTLEEFFESGQVASKTVHYDIDRARKADVALVRSKHKRVIRRALREGKPVPPEVLADYPELKKAAAPSRVAAKYQKKKEVPKTDGKGTTTVYEYSDRQVNKRNKDKAERIEKLRGKMSDLRTQVKKDLSSKDPATKLTALAIALMDETYERVGNEESAKEGHYGVTNWQVEHVSLGKGKATISYTGKSGVKHKKEVSNAKTLSVLRDAVKGKKKGEKLLCDGDECDILAKDVNAYLKPYGVTAKDIRGLHANEEMKTRLKAVRSKGGKLPEDKKERDQKLKDEFKEALEAASEAVGHEASTLKSQYLVPGLEDSYLKDGTVIDKLKAAAAEGECYPWATRFAREHDGAVIYHGTVISPRDPLGRRLGHAWVEWKGKAYDWQTVEYFKESPLSVSEYRKVNQARVDYSMDSLEASICMMRSRHHGPWTEAEREVLKGFHERDEARMKKRRRKRASEMQPWDTCPVCGEGYQSRCRCHMGERTCLNGHQWLWCDKHEVPVVVPEGVKPHDVVSMRAECKCPVGEVVPKVATKSDAEKEDEEARRLLRQDPKKKPPRKDLRRRLMETDDKEEKDKDLSLNYKDIGAAARVAAQYESRQVLREFLAAEDAEEGGDGPNLDQRAQEQGQKEYEEYKKDRPETELGVDHFVKRVKERLKKEEAKAKEEAKKPKKQVPTGLVDPSGKEIMKEEEPKPPKGESKKEKAEREKAEVEQVEKAEAAEKQRKVEQAVKDAEKAFKGIQRGSTLPASFQDDLKSSMGKMSPADREAFSTSFAETLQKIKEDPPSIESARETMESKEVSDDPAKAGAQMAEALYAERVTLNPLLIGDSPLPKETEPVTDANREAVEAARRERAEQSYDHFSKMPEGEWTRMADVLGDEYDGLDPESPRAQEIEAIYHGMALAAAAKNLPAPKSAKGGLAVPESGQFNRVVKLLQGTGDEKILLGSVGDITSPDSQKVVRNAVENLSLDELGDFIGGEESPLYGIIRDLQDPKISKRLSDKDKKELRAMVESSIVDNVALLDPMAGDYLAANGKEVTPDEQAKLWKDYDKQTSKDQAESIKKMLAAGGEDEEDEGEPAKRSAMELIADEMRKARIKGFRKYLQERFDKKPEHSKHDSLADVIDAEDDLRALNQRVLKPHEVEKPKPSRVAQRYQEAG